MCEEKIMRKGWCLFRLGINKMHSIDICFSLSSLITKKQKKAPSPLQLIRSKHLSHSAKHIITGRIKTKCDRYEKITYGLSLLGISITVGMDSLCLLMVVRIISAIYRWKLFFIPTNWLITIIPISDLLIKLVNTSSISLILESTKLASLWAELLLSTI